MNRLYLLCCIVFIYIFPVKSQSPDFHKHFTFKPSYTHILKTPNSHQFRLEVDYRFNRFSDLGAYIGFRRIPVSDSHYMSTQPLQKVLKPSYGIVGNLHLFPLLIKQDNFRFDLYVSFKAGVYHILSNNEYPPYKGGFEYGLFGGGAINLSRSVGLFIEYGATKYSAGKYGFFQVKPLTYGLNIRLDGGKDGK